MLQHCVLKIKMIFELDNVYICMYKCVASFSVWYFDTKKVMLLFSTSDTHPVICIIYNILYKMFEILCF